MANGNVLYLPPGVTAPSPMPVQMPMPSGIPFDRKFFESILPQSVASFCSATKCEIPRVELLTVDGTTHFVSGIVGVADSFVVLQAAKEDHLHTIEVFIPYNTIFRVEVHPETELRRRMGFVAHDDVTAISVPEPEVEVVEVVEAPVAVAAASKKSMRPAARKK